MTKLFVKLSALSVLLLSCLGIVTELPQEFPTSAATEMEVPIETVQKESVSEKIPIGDGGIITGHPCEAPCFEGVYPGKTSFDEAFSILANTDVDKCLENGTDLILSCGDNLFLGADLQTRLINSIEYYPQVEIPVGQLILKYGTPSTVIVIPLGVPEMPYVTIILLFEDFNLRVDLPNLDGVEYPVEESTIIDFVVYYDDIKYTEMKGNYFSLPWDGYRVYIPSGVGA